MQELRLLTALCVSLLAATAIPAALVDFPSDLEKWIAVDPPEHDSEGWLVANNDAAHEWLVTLRDGRPRVQLRTPETPAPLPFKIDPGSPMEGLAGRRFSVKVSDGWLVGFNAGEFGAGIWWFSPDGARRYKIAEASIKGFIPTEAGLLAIAGIAHGGTNKGQILRLVQDPKGRWRSETFIDLKHAPEVAVKIPDGSIFIATTDRFLRVVPSEKKVEVRVKDAFWGGLYPNSLVVASDGTAYLGMRHGVVKIEQKGGAYKVVWLLPNIEFVEMQLNEGLQ